MERNRIDERNWLILIKNDRNRGIYERFGWICGEKWRICKEVNVLARKLGFVIIKRIGNRK